MMKYSYCFLLFLLISGFTNAQKIEFQTLLSDKISIRAIEIWKNRVYYVGTDSKFGYIDLKNLQDKKQISLSKNQLQFRTLAQDQKYFYTVNIESPAYFFRINKKTLKPEIRSNDTLKTAFYDAVHTFENRLGYAFSDPDSQGNMRLARIQLFRDSNWEMVNFKQPLVLEKGEAAFAASNSNIASAGNWMWIATGGTKSRIFRMNKNHPEALFEIFETPFVQGSASQGIYSIDFYNDKFGIAVGGDYTQQSENISNIATTNDGGKTWQIQASGENPGYMTCVKIRPGSKGKDIVAIGDQHISLSTDFGKTWNVVSEEKGFYVGAWIDRNNIILAGKGKIAKMKVF